MDRVLRVFPSNFIRRGSIVFTTASGTKFSCGDGTSEPVLARFVTTEAQRRVMLNAEFALGEASFFDQPTALPVWAKPQWWLGYLIRRVRQFNQRGRSQQNVAHHCDLDGRRYSLLDPCPSGPARLVPDRP